MASSITRIPTSTCEKFEDFQYKYCLSICAASVAETVTYPLDIIKTRLQIQGEDLARGINQTKPKGFFSIGIGIIQNEGILQLWRGIPPAIYRHFIYSGCRMTIYEGVRDIYLSDDQSNQVLKSLCVGVFAGALGQFLASPVDLVKVRMQMEGRRLLQGLPPRVTSTSQALIQILRESGIRGLWKGWAPNVYRAALVNLGDLTTYDRAKHFILANTNLKDNYVSHSMASCCSGFVAAVFATPADVIRTRVMNQPTDEKGRGMLYHSSTDCLMKTFSKEGFFALYKGFFPIWARMAPWSFTFWVSYEELRRLAGVKSF
ncbi:mitochondrial uncoupling protein 4-like [Tropilaelaps mercedesae]|uniref:Mitochondrial uncoupling protein 4-like n=1 Tax=Tropilaelaps mercedesae TaxID=418985 RepID=A0A1V9Y154_9ACAR|nr:mitochondrial uncoupling protein 4-like [Tropilaelaps mercedesae]